MLVLISVVLSNACFDFGGVHYACSDFGDVQYACSDFGGVQ